MQSVVNDPSTPDGLIDRSRDATVQLAIDEAMLMMADEGKFPGNSNFVRVWEFHSPTVVLGRSSKIDLETDREQCKQQSISIYRRASGGATVMGGPGCLMYSLIGNTESNPALRRIDEAHAFVMERLLQAVRRQAPEVTRQGICDLTIDDNKFSGNSLRIARRHLLYHGTVLYDFNLDQIHRCLRFAPRQPEYRKQRDHGDFISNLSISPERLAEDLHDVFGAESSVPTDRFLDRAKDLVETRYACEAWRDRH